MFFLSQERVRALDVFRVFYRASTILSSVFFVFLFIAAVGEVEMGTVAGYYPTNLTATFAQDPPDIKKFSKLTVEYILLEAACVLIIALKYFFGDRLALAFRERLVTQIHEKYLKGNAFYDLLMYDADIDNPDARITDDITFYGKSLIKVLIDLSQAPFYIIYYAIMTNKDMGPRILLADLAFAVVSFLVTRLVMTPAVKTTYALEAANGDFRLAHVDLKENAETVALSSGQSSEKRLLSVRLQSALTAQRRQAHASFLTNFVSYLCQNLGTAITYLCIYLYRPAGDIVSFYYRVSYEAGQVMWGVTLFMSVFTEFAKLTGYSTRIYELLTVLDEHKALTTAAECGESFVVRDVTIDKPNGDPLLKDLTFTINKGESLFISGPSGAGKSSIFRVLGHIWPIQSGSVVTPEFESNSLLLLTQKPYLPPVNNLDECIAFPMNVSDVSEEDLQNVKSFLKIESLGERDTEDWINGLSPGEQQRIALARLFIHKPEYALLDEATSAIPQVLEQEVFSRLKEMGVTCLTIAHNQELRAYHKYSLDLDGEGSYSFYENTNQPN